MYYSNIKYFSTVNGIGVRTAFFVSGCDKHCKGCYNKEAWNYHYGQKYTSEVEEKILDSIDKPYISGLSLLGGEPLSFFNVETVKELILHFRERYGNTKDIWLWTGFYVKELSESQLEVAKMCDYVIDGPYEEPETYQHYRFKGSANQNIWQVVNGEFVKSNIN